MINSNNIVSPILKPSKPIDIEIFRKKQRLLQYDQERIKLLQLKANHELIVNKTLNEDDDEQLSDVEIVENEKAKVNNENETELLNASNINDEERLSVTFVYMDINKTVKEESLNILTTDTWATITKKLINRFQCISLSLLFDGEKLQLSSTPADSDISKDDRIDLKIIWPNPEDISKYKSTTASLQNIKLNIDYIDVFKQNKTFIVDVLLTNTWSFVIDKLKANFKMDDVKLNYGGSPLHPREHIEKSELANDDHIYADIKWSDDTEVSFKIWAIDKSGKKVEFSCQVKYFKPWRDVNIQVAKILHCKVAAINFAGSEFDSSTTPAESAIAFDSKLEAKIKR